MLGWLVYAAIYLGFAFARTPAEIWVLFMAYGVYHGLTEGAEKALVRRGLLSRPPSRVSPPN